MQTVPPSTRTVFLTMVGVTCVSGSGRLTFGIGKLLLRTGEVGCWSGVFFSYGPLDAWLWTNFIRFLTAEWYSRAFLFAMLFAIVVAHTICLLCCQSVCPSNDWAWQIALWSYLKVCSIFCTFSSTEWHGHLWCAPLLWRCLLTHCSFELNPSTYSLSLLHSARRYQLQETLEGQQKIE